MNSTEHNLLQLLNNFILDCERGKHLQANGKRIKVESIKNYKNLGRLILQFTVVKDFSLRIKNLSKCTPAEYLKEKRYWKRFYHKITHFMYKECDHYDNYVGANFRLLRSFFNYLNFEKGIDTRQIQNTFFIAQEDIPIVTLNPEQLNLLISDEVFHKSLPERLIPAKDVFVFGCTVGLRISDLMALTKQNIEKIYEDFYLKIESKKTQTFTRIKLPPYAIEILRKYSKQNKSLLPHYHVYTLNKYFREIAELAGWTYPVQKLRQKRGIKKEIKLFHSNKTYRFCDLITSHTMRRTAITTLLNFGMPEHLVRKISGHAPRSKEFYRYVQYSQNFLDQEIDKVYSNLKNLSKPEQKGR